MTSRFANIGRVQLLLQAIKKWYYLNNPHKLVDLLDQNILQLHMGLKISFNNPNNDPKITSDILRIVALRFNHRLSDNYFNRYPNHKEAGELEPTYSGLHNMKFMTGYYRRFKKNRDFSRNKFKLNVSSVDSKVVIAASYSTNILNDFELVHLREYGKTKYDKYFEKLLIKITCSKNRLNQKNLSLQFNSSSSIQYRNNI